MQQSRQKYLIIILLLAFNVVSAQWTRITSIPANHIIALIVNDNKIYAASDANEIYKSSDEGVIWDTLKVSINPIDITSLIIFNNKIYAGTFTHGVFHSSDKGNTWQNNSSNPSFISDFAVKDNILYASTLGNGIAVLDTITDNWTFINDSLPGYSINVQNIIGSPNFLIVAAGSNGTFYKYDFVGNYWIEELYYGRLRPGLQIDNLINDADTIFAVNGNRIIKSNDAGETWTDDKSGTTNGLYRNIYAGASNNYILTNTVTGGTWIQQRSKYADIGTSWADNEEFINNGFSYDIIEFNGKLFLGRDSGLYVKGIVSGIIENTKTSNLKFYLYPNPSFGGAINVGSEKDIVSLEVFNAIGEVVYKTNVNKSHFQINSYFPNGIYFLRLNLKDEIRTSKLIILK